MLPKAAGPHIGLVRRRDQGRACTCWGNSRRCGWAGKVVHVRRGRRKEGEEIGTQKWDKVYLTLKLFKTSEKLLSPHTCTAYYFLWGRKGSSRVNMNEEFQCKCPLRFVSCILGKNKWLWGFVDKNIGGEQKYLFNFFFNCILWCWGMVTFSFWSVLRISLFYNVWGVQLLYYLDFNGLSKGISVIQLEDIVR